MKNNEKKLNCYRDELDVIDDQFLGLLEKRFEITKKIGEIKKEIGKKTIDKEREDIIIAKKIQNTKLDKNFVKMLFRVIFKESYRTQR